MKLAHQLKNLIREEEKERGFHIFANKHRRDVFRELTRAPCQTSSAIAKTLNYDVQDVEWHLRKLIENGFVEKREHKKRLFYPSGLVMDEDVPLFALINKKSGWLIVNSLKERCRDMPFLYRHVSRSTAYRVVDELRTLGLIEEMKGSKRLICLNENFYDKIEKYDAIGIEFKKKFINRVERRGYRVEVIGTYKYELTIRIFGIENFTLGIYISPLRTILEGRVWS